MKAVVLTVGTEILFGQITNTNSAYISRELNNLGIDVMYHCSVGDNAGRLKEIINLAFSQCDLIITTGGLGPTQDDLTKETIAEAMGDIIVENPECLAELKKYYDKTGRNMTANNLKQAHMPSKAVVLPNDQGTAPGFALERDGKTIIALPGPPREMTRMFRLQVKPFLEKRSDSHILYKILRFFGIGESKLETELLPLIDNQSDPTIATYAKEGECSIRVASKAPTVEAATEAVNQTIEKIRDIVGEFIYSDDDEDLIEVVGKKLIEKNITISSAESCTGGLFASNLTDVSGISQVFKNGFVTYSNESKIEVLGVKEETLEKFGAVSPETAAEMADGLKKKTGSDICISVTGLAGPGGGTAETPVGLAYIGIAYGDNPVKTTVVKSYYRDVNRKWNKNYTVLRMLYEVYKIIKGEF